MANLVFDYSALLQKALREVVRSVLQQVAEEGLAGDHHFYLTFRTDHAGVELPDLLRRRHPEEMTIVLQNQFWDLAVDQEAFGVTLRFDGVPQRLTVPFEALKSFIDPAAEFGLRFQDTDEDAAREMAADEPQSEDKRPRAAPAESAQVVSIDRFRKKDTPEP